MFFSHFFIQVGVGMCMEGIEHNPVVYELMPEMAFRKDQVNVEVKKLLLLLHFFVVNFLNDNFKKIDHIYLNAGLVECLFS